MADAVRLSPTRLAALRLVAAHRVATSTDASNRLWFVDAFRDRTGDDEWLPTAPMRWLMGAGLAVEANPGGIPCLVLTPAGQAALDAHPTPTEGAPAPAPARKLAPGRLAALRLASTGMVKLSSVEGSRPWFTNLTPRVRYRTLDSTPFRWLIAQELVETTEIPNAHVPGSHRRLVLTPAGTAALTAHPEETDRG